MSMKAGNKLSCKIFKEKKSELNLQRQPEKTTQSFFGNFWGGRSQMKKIIYLKPAIEVPRNIVWSSLKFDCPILRKKTM